MTFMSQVYVTTTQEMKYHYINQSTVPLSYQQSSSLDAADIVVYDSTEVVPAQGGIDNRIAPSHNVSTCSPIYQYTGYTHLVFRISTVKLY